MIPELLLFALRLCKRFFICKITCPKKLWKGRLVVSNQSQLLYKQEINFSILTFLVAVFLVTTSLKFFGLCNYEPFPDDFHRSEISNNSLRHSPRDMLQRQFASYEMRKKFCFLKFSWFRPSWSRDKGLNLQSPCKLSSLQQRNKHAIFAWCAPAGLLSATCVLFVHNIGLCLYPRQVPKCAAFNMFKEASLGWP